MRNVSNSAARSADRGGRPPRESDGGVRRGPRAPRARGGGGPPAAQRREYIETFVSYGYQREAMSDSERAVFDSRVNQAIVLSTPSALYKLSAAVTSLNEAGESDLANEISSFNIITQYVFFDLLK